MIICPNKICKQEMPDDSCFCDQCGIQLRRCDKCGFIGTGKFCGSCGGTMSAIQPPNETLNTPAPSNEVLADETAAAPSATATVIVSLPAEKISMCHLEGWNMEIADGDIIGRTNGPHAAMLGKFPVISSNHAKITRENGAWFITDLNSTNKTYVNGMKLEPNVPAAIKQDDVVVFANVTFTVRLA
jgi:hypothetical protein